MVFKWGAQREQRSLGKFFLGGHGLKEVWVGEDVSDNTDVELEVRGGP